ncbi:hypothetical protein Pyrfu_0426 [Pyrolobus fumarii 1A]|uniref:Tyrosine specific protein phosphatases domain-containing protein n=1 Tax=Pyrolobus fumarii (strain DSM 11204 / 1A) TaxID=694429 RepID=G0EG49_PYRF1|nr:protein-tyrosine phosphatase family protein [Pyrolobus fumarii]AEM38297.1 hypothetical protein Pyrfu_0426 [Pyrolobus fumarii 1A]
MVRDIVRVETRLGVVYGGPCVEVLEYVDAPVIILEEEYCDVEPNTYCYPVEDFSVEPWVNVKGAARKALELLQREGRVAICCAGGCGRTGTVASAVIAVAEGISCHDAIRVYSEKRGLECPETDEQRRAVCRLTRELEKLVATAVALS